MPYIEFDDGTWGTCSAVKTYHTRDREPLSERNDESPGYRLHKLVEANRRATGRSYADAMTAVLADPANAGLKRAYAEKGY